MSRVVSLRLKDGQVVRLERAARRFGRTISETAALLIEEALRQGEFAFIEFRDSPIGRQAYVKSSRLAVWQLVALAEAFGGDAERVAAHLEVPSAWVKAALAYARAYPAEIDAAVEDNADAATRLTRLVPNLEVVAVDASAP